MTDLEIGINNAAAAAADDEVGQQVPTVSKNVTDRKEGAPEEARPKTKTRRAEKYREKTKFVVRAARERATKGLAWFWKDMGKSHLLWVKVIFLFQSASLVTLYPYLTIHMR